ncbi:hypothetical protein BTO30_11400 [Domibacillus antri]|uniref:Uncharacterized protein n=1 Tax=Domibacillus antri TaxID=1714264 RepID=A0A1Q8Q488_9BACI|nr:hypothetical protein [Domibacillus antri]OLN22091.1 hypothetical protein BTO30_11400 [Domibacillus antri]
MLSASGIKPFVTGELAKAAIEADHNHTHRITISFKDREDEHIGDLDIYFVVKGFGREDANEEIDVHFSIPFFSSFGPDGERFLEEAEAMQFIFIHFATEVQDVIDDALDALYEQYEKGSSFTE